MTLWIQRGFWTVFAALLWLVPVAARPGEPVAEPAISANSSGEPELLGELTREEIEAAIPDWVSEQVEATPDAVAASELLSALAGAEVTVYLGTWCSDSRRELARLWRALDGVGADSPAEIRYVGVDGDKEAPHDLVVGQDLRYVPTFIVRRNGKELGRIVEESPQGIEIDLLELLRGDRQGLVTAKEELLGGEVVREHS